MTFDILLLLAIFVLNGLFAMSEIAIVSSSRTRLMQLAEGGSNGARRALELAAEPTRFLSSVQVGITCIGILSGAIGEASIAVPLRDAFERMPLTAPYATTMSLVVMVVALTFVSLIVGELVPKRIAMAHPELIASIVATPMRMVAMMGRPLVHALSVTTDAVLRLLRVRVEKKRSVTVDEIRLLLRQGADEGVVDESEHTIVSNVLDLDDRVVASVLTHRADVVFLDVHEARDAVRRKLRDNPHSVLPLCDGGLDHVVGFVRASRLLDRMLDDPAPDLAALAEPALFVPETMSLMALLEQLKSSDMTVALVVDEFGGIEGLVSLADVTGAVIGSVPTEPGDEPMVVRRADGTWLMDGALSIGTLEDALEAEPLLSAHEERQCHTLGGLAMVALGRLPRTGDVFVRGGYRFEIVDMDGKRVDRVLVTPQPPASSLPV